MTSPRSPTAPHRACVFLLALMLALVLAACSTARPRAGARQVEDWAKTQQGLGACTWDELWVVERAPEDAASAPAGWSVRDPRTGAPVALPLASSDLRADVVGRLSTITVRQHCVNPFDEAVEGEYSFPLPRNAAVSDFVVTIGAREIRGIVREREEAERIYAAARAQGLLATLLREEAPGRFSQRVAHLAARSSIVVTLEYFQAVACRDGWCELALPLASADERSVAVDVDAGVPIGAVECSPRAADATRARPERLSLALRGDELGGASEFRLRYRVAGETMRAALFGSTDADGGTFCLLVFPGASSPGGDLEIDWSDLAVHDVYSDAHPAADQARVFLGRYRGGGGRIRVQERGRDPVRIELQAEDVPARCLPRTWARARIAELSRASAASPDALRSLALEQGLSSLFTAFVLVDTRS